MSKVGDRIGAVAYSEKDTIYLLGYGVYEGHFVPDEKAVGEWTAVVRENNSPNPRLRLDTGEVLYGIQCWWGPEDKIRAMCEHRTVVHVRLAEDGEFVRRDA